MNFMYAVLLSNVLTSTILRKVRQASLVAAATVALFSFAFLSSASRAEVGPKYATTTVRMSESHEYLQKSVAPDFWALIPNYRHQETPGSCSVATLTVVLNGMRSGQKLTASDELFTEKSVTKKLNPMKLGADKGIRGVSLDGQFRVLKRAIQEYKLGDYDLIEERIVDSSEATLKKVETLLIENEKSTSDFLMALFIQGQFTGDPEGMGVGHFATVAAYDQGAKRVLILDPDRDYYEPYWVSLKTFVDGMADKADTVKTGGYIYVKKKSN